MLKGQTVWSPGNFLLILFIKGIHKFTNCLLYTVNHFISVHIYRIQENNWEGNTLEKIIPLNIVLFKYSNVFFLILIFRIRSKYENKTYENRHGRTIMGTEINCSKLLSFPAIHIKRFTILTILEYQVTSFYANF